MSILNFFNRNFIIILHIQYPATGSNQSWVKLVMVKLVISSREAGEIQLKRRLPKLVK